ncbi:MAG: hypothetical protein ACRCX2_37930 [Paraclostridium sp.]
MSKFATLGLWVLNSLGAEFEDIESLIGEFPTLEETIDRELNDNDLELIEIADRLGLSYEITKDGIRLGK